MIYPPLFRVCCFLSTGYTLISSKISLFILCSNEVNPAISFIYFISAVFSLMPLCSNRQISQPYKSDLPVKYHMFAAEIFFGLNMVSRIVRNSQNV